MHNTEITGQGKCNLTAVAGEFHIPTSVEQMSAPRGFPHVLHNVHN